MKVYKDTPHEILNLLIALDFSAIDETNKNILLDQLEAILQKFLKYIPSRDILGATFDINIPGCPKRLESIINKYHWAKIGYVHKTIAMPFIKNWFNQNLPKKKGVKI